MTERRQVARQQPLEVEVWDGRVYEAHPLPWLERNDLGNEILRRYNESFNEAIQAYTDPEGTARLNVLLEDKIKEPLEILKLAYPKDSFEGLHWPEIFELIYASLEVNNLNQLKPLIDPNSLTPEKNSGTSSTESLAGVMNDIRRMPSMRALGLLGSDDEESSNSPTMKSTPSSESGTSSSGMTGTGD